MIIFLKAVTRGDKSTGGLFDAPVDVAGFMRKDGVYVAPHHSRRKKKLIREVPAASAQGDMFGPAPAKTKAVDDRQGDMFAVAAPAPKVEPVIEARADPLAGIPAAVLDRVRGALDILREIKGQIDSVRSTIDGPMAGGGGRYEADVLDNRKADIEHANKTLTTFRHHAPDNKVDADAVLSALGGVADLTPSKGAAEWMKPNGNAIEEAPKAAPDLLHCDQSTYEGAVWAAANARWDAGGTVTFGTSLRTTLVTPKVRDRLKFENGRIYAGQGRKWVALGPVGQAIDSLAGGLGLPTGFARLQAQAEAKESRELADGTTAAREARQKDAAEKLRPAFHAVAIANQKWRENGYSDADEAAQNALISATEAEAARLGIADDDRDHASDGYRPQEGDTHSVDGVTYVLRDSRWHRTVAEPAPASAEATAPTQVSPDIETRARLERLRGHKSTTAAQESEIKMLEARLKSDPKKWRVGHGVGRKVHSGGGRSQTNRGFRIAAIDAPTKMALIRSVADTGLTSSGGDNDRIAPEWVHLADLVRDKKYDAQEGGPPSGGGANILPTKPAPVLVFGVPAGTTKAARKKANAAAAALLKAKTDAEMTDADRQSLARYTGAGGIGDSLNEFYTDPGVARSMWSILANLGVTGGDVLEPSCATGVFQHTAPAGVHVVGVEMDPTSARIAGILHGPAGHETNNASLERFATQDGRQFDAVIGNVPFGIRGGTVSDDKPDLATAEQYFLDTALDKTKDGGVVALIVPTGIMDSATGRAFRERVMRKGEFLGAHRLPNTAFEAAHTGVTTDIVVFRKRPQEVAGALSTLSQDQLRAVGVWDSEFLAGDYFTGSGAGNVMGRTEDGWRAKAGLGHDITVQGSMDGIPEALEQWHPATSDAAPLTVERILESLGDDAKAKRAAVNAAMKNPYQVAKPGDVRVINGIRYVLQGEPPRWHRAEGETPEAVEDAHRIGELLDDLTDGRMKDKHLGRAQLTEALDAYVAEHGAPSRNKDLARWLKSPSLPIEDGASPADHADRVKQAQRRAARLLGAVNDDGSYSDLVTGRDRAGESAGIDTVATKLSLETGGFSVDQLAAAAGHADRGAVLDHLFASPGYAVLPDGQTWITLDSYVSGELWAKLDAAKAAAAHEGLAPEYKAKYDAQIAALDAAIDQKSLEDVEILITSGFVTPAVLDAWFAARKKAYEDENRNASWSPSQVKVTYADGWWDIKIGGSNGNWDADFVGKILNRSGVRKDDKEKVERLHREFREWLLSSPIRESVEEDYNRRYRGFRPAAYSEAPIAIPGLNPAINANGYHFAGLRWALEAGKGIIAADVGLGKTARGLMLAKLAKATGEAKKPTFVVPKSVLANWMREAEFWFPGSRCLVIGETFTTDKDGNTKSVADTAEVRRRKYQDMQQNDYDFVFISQPAWNDLEVDPITKGQYTNDDFWVKRGDKLGNAGSKKLNQVREAYNQALAKREFGKREDTLYFGDLGIDMLILDEAHAFKNLFSVERVFGGESPKFLGGSGESKRAQDTFFKTRQLKERTGGKGVFMLTATPTKNSPLEIYSMLSHIAPEAFERLGIKNSGDFLDRFCEFKQDAILTTSGKVEEALVTAGFKNLGELREVMKRYIDRKTADDVGLVLPARQDHQHLVDMTDEQEAVYQELRAAAADVGQGDDTGDCHIFSIMSRMGKASIDLSMLGPEHAGARSPKIETAARNVAEGVKDGGQIVFCDHVDTHEKIAAAMVAAGIPRNQIGIINGQATAGVAARQKISDDFNSGKIKVVIGNTATMGEGVNLQKGTTDIHHLDLPWEPASVQQRNGRGLRQGNTKEAVRIHTYLAKGSFDGYRYQTITSKKDWQDLLWHGDDRVENLAREGRFSRTDMLIMLSANPEAAKAQYDADKAAALERKTVEDRGKAVDLFSKFQEMRGSIAKMRAAGITTGAAFDRARARAKRIKETLRDTSAFPHKHLLDSDAPALIEPVTGHAYHVGSGFETDGTADCPVREAAKWVVTEVDRATGTFTARKYGTDASSWPGTFAVADMKAGAVPFAYSEADEVKEVAEHAVKAKLSGLADGKLKSITDLSGLPDSVIEANRDHYLSTLKQAMRDYKNDDRFSHVPLVDSGGNLSLHSTYQARDRLADHDVMLPTAVNRDKAIDAWAEAEMGKRKGKSYDQARGKTVARDVIHYPAIGYEKPQSNPWTSIIKKLYGDAAEKEAVGRYKGRLQEAIDAAPSDEAAAALAREIAPTMQYGSPSTIVTHAHAKAALAARATKTEGALQ